MNNRIIKFLMVGTFSAGVNISFLYLFTEYLKVIYIVSFLFSYQLSVISNYILHSVWTFKDIKLKSYLRGFYTYEFSIVFVFLTSYSILISLVELFKVNYIIANLTGIFISSIVHFRLSKKNVWIK